ncbi:MAG TPA: cupin domain-containing protein [Syntrophorhabdaceae bacterium]|nr:cupin domain-containing protein [Syntrophorhabdaceae bacterium]
MKITNLKKTERQLMAMEGAKDTYKQIPISARDGTPAYSFRVFTIMPGGHTPYHTHDFEHINYIIDGEGAVVKEDGTEQPVFKGDFALIMPGEKHQYKNKGKEPLIIICAVPKEYE